MVGYAYYVHLSLKTFFFLSNKKLYFGRQLKSLASLFLEKKNDTGKIV